MWVECEICEDVCVICIDIYILESKDGQQVEEVHEKCI